MVRDLCIVVLATAFVVLSGQAFAVTLEPGRLPGMCLSMTGKAGQAESRECDGSLKQELTLPGPKGGPIGYGGKCLKPKGMGRFPNVRAETCDGSDGQTWTMSPAGVVSNKASQCLSVMGSASRSGTQIHAGACAETADPHQWRQVDVVAKQYQNVPGRFELAAQPGMCLSFARPGSFFGLAACRDVSDQRFSFDKRAPGQLRSQGACLSSVSITHDLTLADCWKEPAMQWELTPSGQLKNGQQVCAAVRREGDRDVVRVAACREAPEQVWTLLQGGGMAALAWPTP
jgi:Ricin-type beta-trefoil lectin domain